MKTNDAKHVMRPTANHEAAESSIDRPLADQEPAPTWYEVWETKVLPVAFLALIVLIWVIYRWEQ